MIVIASLFLIVGGVLLIWLILSLAPEKPTVWQTFRLIGGFISLALCLLLIVDLRDMLNKADRGYLSPITIMETGTSYDLITSGELETMDKKITYWLIIKDHDGVFRALTSGKKPPSSNQVVMMSDQENGENIYYLLPYERKLEE